MQHLLKKQILELDVHHKVDAFSIQQKIGQFYRDEIVVILEKIFDELSDEEVVMSFDKIEIDLGVITAKDIEKRSLVNLYEIISSQLRELASQTNTAKKHSSPGNVHAPVRRSKAISIARQWLFYMQHGYLCWNVIATDEIWYTAVLEGLAVDFESINELRHLINTDQRAVSRIIYQHEEKFLQQLIEVITARKQTDLLSFIDELAKITTMVSKARYEKQNLELKKARQDSWILLFTAAATGEGNITVERLNQKILERIIPDIITAEAVINTLPGQIRITGPVLQQIVEEFKLLLPEKPSVGISTKKKASGISDQAKRGGKDRSTEDTPDQEKKHVTESNTPEKKNLSATFPQLDEEGIFVPNAGVVLLHPFLNSFFKNLLIVKDGEFTSISNRQKAMYLLHYLATGRSVAEEHELVVPKLLCAYNFEEPVPKDIELSEEEMKEANYLLEAAISQWGILKNTSPAGLRESFLQRNGKMYSKNDTLYLQVETNSIDIVLDYLPWNLNMIKLQWMKEILRLEWR